MKNPFKFAPIQTKFDGYHFRSRLEARHAVFFKTLGIPYEYEREGFSLEGTPYLPDFWLPQQDCYVEIKGQTPTTEEIQKAEKLALYTGKEVYIIDGNIGLSSGEYTHNIQGFCPPSLQICTKDTERDQPVSGEIRAILQRLEETDLLLRLDRNGEWCFLSPPFGGFLTTKLLQYYIRDLQGQLDALKDVAPFLMQYEEDLRAALTVGEDETPRFYPQGQIEGIEWSECLSCGNILLTYIDTPDEYRLHHDCPTGERATYVANSPRLMEAYTAARQARFEREAAS